MKIITKIRLMATLITLVMSICTTPIVATATVLLDATSCQDSSSLKGIWDGGTNTCTITVVDAETPLDDVLQIDDGITLHVNYAAILTIANSDKILNRAGTINNEGSIENNGGIIENRRITRDIVGTVNNFGTINNNSGGTISNLLYYALINNFGTINNDMDSIVIVEAAINNNSGGIINNSGNINQNLSNIINNHGAVINNLSTGTINEGGGITNYSGATIINTSGGTINIFLSTQNTNGGKINNHGGIIDNFGTITIDYRTIESSGILNNNSGGIIKNNSGGLNGFGGGIRLYSSGVINNKSGGLITNSINAQIRIDGILHNSGIIENLSGGNIDALGNGSQNNPGGIIIGGNSGVLNNNYDGVIDNSSDSDILITAGGIINNEGTIDNTVGANIALNERSAINNLSDGVIHNNGTLYNNILNYPDTGINNSGIINNNVGATISMDSTAGGTHVNNSGIINNVSVINIDIGGTVENFGTIDNSGTVNIESFTTINNLASGIINNDGGIINNNSQGSSYGNEGINNLGTIDNNIGIINNSVSGTIINNFSGTIDNNSGTVDNSGNITNDCDGTLLPNIVDFITSGNPVIDLCPDTVPPEITLVGDDPQIIEAGTPYSELGATAFDDVDGDISSSIVIDYSSVNTAILGTYIVTYNVSDAAGNAAPQETRTVNVVDTTPPIITLLGSNPVTVGFGFVYTDAGATASDNLDGDITSNIIVTGLPIDTGVLGTNTVTYDVMDISGNVAIQAVRTVNVIDTTPPVISDVPSDVTLEATGPNGAVHTYASPSANDTVDGQIAVLCNPLSGSTFPYFSPNPTDSTVLCTATDNSGNESQVTFIVTVSDTTPPVITLQGSSIVDIEIGSPYADAGAVASDVVDGDITSSIVSTGLPIDTGIIGTNTLTYDVIDSSGNAAVQITRTVNVIPLNVPPIITSIDVPIEPVPVGYIDATVNFMDDDIPFDSHFVTWDWDDGVVDYDLPVLPVGTDSFTTTHEYIEAGVYTVISTVIDDLGEVDEFFSDYVVVYDPNGSFVTGGGWIDSPEGAYPAEPLLTGMAHFGFVSRYQKGATLPSGKTDFRFQAAGMDFRSTEYQWLVIAGPSAKFKGCGTINGEGDYGFMVTATDGALPGGGSVDKFRIRLWDRVTDEEVYDNQLGEDEMADATDAIESGAITIHVK